MKPIKLDNETSLRSFAVEDVVEAYWSCRRNDLVAARYSSTPYSWEDYRYVANVTNSTLYDFAWFLNKRIAPATLERINELTEVLEVDNLDEASKTSIQQELDYVKENLQRMQKVGWVGKWQSELKVRSFERYITRKERMLNVKDGYNLGGYIYDKTFTSSTAVHNSPYVVTQGVASKYNPDADCPVFKKRIEIALPDEQERRYFQAMVGRMLDPGSKTFGVLQGPPDSGKSLIFGMLQDAFGPYIGVAGSQLIFSKNEDFSAGDMSSIMSLANQILMVCEESSSKHFVNAPRLKAITGGTSMQGKYMHGNMEKVEVSCNVLLLTNELPDNVSLMDDGIMARRLVLPTLQVVHRDTVLTTPDGQELKTADDVRMYVRNHESAGVISWLIEGIKMWHAHDFVEPEATKAKSEDMTSYTYNGDVDEWLDTTGFVALKDEQVVNYDKQGVPVNMLLRSYSRGRRISIKASTFCTYLERAGFKISKPKVRPDGRSNGGRKVLNLGFELLESDKTVLIDRKTLGDFENYNGSRLNLESLSQANFEHYYTIMEKANIGSLRIVEARNAYVQSELH